MTSPATPAAALEQLAARWADAKPAERANAQTYLIELCEALGLPRPQPAGSGYEFEFALRVGSRDGTETQGFVDLYRQGCFVLEAKDYADGRGSDLALRRAYGQARIYANNDPSGVAPPYLLVLDVARTLLVFHRWGGTFQGFTAGHRIDLPTLHTRPADVQLLRDVWLDPSARDPRVHAQAVTREIAAKLARLAAALEARGLEQERVARFLMRVVFSCFAEDVGLLPREAFRQTVQNAGVGGDPQLFARAVEGLWKAMDEGGMFGYEKFLRFNGSFFHEAEALPLTREEIVLLLEAARADWKDVEPTVFGTLLTRALDPAERHRLGAEYTPREFIERLIKPTVEEPVRERWTAVQAEVLQLRETGKPKDRAAAEQRLRDFLEWMRGLRVLDPACGSGNFLYVTMHLLKDIEHEAVRELEGLTGHLELRMEEIGPRNFLGIEVKPWAREIAELVLWVGYHQFWKRHHAVQPPEPVLQETGTLALRDAVLAWDEIRHDPSRDRPDPTPRIVHPVTGELVPDPAARLPYMEYVGARASEWPEADFIVGNPPYLGKSRQREALGDGYVDALRRAYPEMPDGADYVMYWWDKAAGAIAAGCTKGAGLITTKSIIQVLHRPILRAAAARGVRVAWAVPDHPWVADADAADVRVAMTVLRQSPDKAVRIEVDAEARVIAELRVPALNLDLSAHADVATAAATPLKSSQGLATFGFMLAGNGFVVDAAESARLLSADERNREVLRPYCKGKELLTRPRGLWVIDFGLRGEAESASYPVLFDIVRDRVKPDRDANKRASRAANWWRFGEPNPKLRGMIAGLPRYIATVETAKHRIFMFLTEHTAPDHKIVVIASADAFLFGVLSSAIHIAWAEAAGSRHGVGNDPVYNKSLCFDSFPSPDPNELLRARIAAVATRLDEHRKAALARDERVTITGMYNVVERLRSGAALTAAERIVHEIAACGTLRDLHDELDRLVAEAYGWSWPEPPALILERLVALHDQRVEEEKAGHVRWLRPDYQIPRFGRDIETPAKPLDLETDEAPATVAVTPAPWPATAVGQIAALRDLAATAPIGVEEATRRFTGARSDIVARHLETLSILGELAPVGDGRYAVPVGAY